MIRSVYLALMFFLIAWSAFPVLNVALADDNTAAEKPAAEPNAQNDEQSDDSTSEETETAAIAKIRELIRAQKLAEATAAMDKAINQWPDSVFLPRENLNLIILLTHENLPLALERFEKVMSDVEKAAENATENAAEGPSLQSRLVFMLAPSLAMSLARAGKVDEALALMDRIQKVPSTSVNGPGVSHLNIRATILMQAGRQDEVVALLNAEFDRYLNDQADLKPEDLQALVTVSEIAGRLLSESTEELDSKIAKFNALLEAKVESEDVTVPTLSAYVRLKTSGAMALADSNPDGALQTLTELQTKLDNIKTESEDEQKQLDRMEMQLRTSQGRIRTIQARLALIGQAAPEINAEHFVNGDQVTLADLKGKVVILDFWAVWCGPCIATFPHLRHLHETYAEDGLVIIGVTKPYSFKWDEETSSAKQDPTTTIDEELEMLEQFRKHHELPYAFAVTAKNADTTSLYAVSGIPQLVVIDQEGVIRLIEVGAGEKTAKSVDAMIEKLLGKPQS